MSPVMVQHDKGKINRQIKEKVDSLSQGLMTPVLILDEPTAALDPIAEREIYEQFNSMVKDKTAIFISHRLASCRFCDKLLVFKDGEIVERGTHQSLLKLEDGLYAKMYKTQEKMYK